MTEKLQDFSDQNMRLNKYLERNRDEREAISRKFGAVVAAATGVRPIHLRIFELAFPHHALERLVRILDAVLVVGPVGRKKLHNLIRAVGGHMADRARREVDGLTDLKLVFLQRDSPELVRHGTAPFERCSPRSARNISAKSAIASKIPLLPRAWL
jgi:hypothetical protein